MKWVLCLLLVSVQAAAKPTEEVCEATAIKMEAGSESLQGARGVLTVLRNRMAINDMTACQVVTQRGQWSWYHKGYKWKLSIKDLQRYEQVCIMPVRLPADVYYFHSGKRKYKLGKYYTTIGHHKFYRL